MARILIVYGTTDGHTQKIAGAMGSSLLHQGHWPEVVNARDCEARHEPSKYDAVVVAASVHASGYQREVRRWVRRHKDQLNAMPTAFVSVCLGILEGRPEVRRELQEILSRFLMRCGWRPTATRIVAGALRWTRYGPIKKRIMKRIVRGTGMSVDTSRDVEFTDWGELAMFAREIAGWTRQDAPACDVLLTRDSW